jgi:2-haloacid dehalogenase
MVASNPLRELDDRRASPPGTYLVSRDRPSLCRFRPGARWYSLQLDEVRDLVAHIERLRPFPEVPEALARLQARYRLVVLSNGDPDMLETAKRYHGIPFDRVISVAVANAFKPHVATYTKAAEIVGVRMDEVVFIANHAFDCIGAKSAGMRAVFIDRRRRPFGVTPHQPDLIVPTMKDLADALI